MIAAAIIGGLALLQQVLLWISPVEDTARLTDRVLFVALLAPLALPWVARVPRWLRAGPGNAAVLLLAIACSVAVYRAVVWSGSLESPALLVLAGLLVGAALGPRSMLAFALAFLVMGAVETATGPSQVGTDRATPLSDSGLFLLIAVPALAVGAVARALLRPAAPEGAGGSPPAGSGPPPPA